MTGLAEELMDLFRVESMEKLQRIDSGWTKLVNRTAAHDTEEALLRDIHTLKGDARVVGLREVSLLSQRLEDLLEAARARDYRVHEDVDVVVTMAIQFIAMLVRKPSRVSKSIDLEGFLKQVDEVTSEWLRESSSVPNPPSSVRNHFGMRARAPIPASSAQRLSTSATMVFLEYLRTLGPARRRIYDAWRSLVENVTDAQRVPLGPMIAAQISTARALAVTLGKDVGIHSHGDEMFVGPEVASAFSVTLLHALTNAIDHGIEEPAARRRAGKPVGGEVHIRFSRGTGEVRLVVEDDGGGVDLDRVRSLAVERGILSSAVAGLATNEALLECVLAPGFSTRAVATDTSGRGIGLDAARAATTDQGGTLVLTSQRGHGSKLTSRVPDARGAIQAIVFDTGTPGVRVAVPATFDVRETKGEAGWLLEKALRLPTDGDRPTHVLEVVGEGVGLAVRSGGLPGRALAIRICPTADTDLFEVVRVDDKEVVLFRPEHLHE